MTALLVSLNDRTFASLRRHRNYRLFFTGQLISVSGTWMQNIALAWLVVELTHSPIAVGALAFCRFIPFTVFGLFAGVLADRVDNRRLVIATQATSMAFSAVLAVARPDRHGDALDRLHARDPLEHARSSSTRRAGTRSPSRWSAGRSCRTPSR